MTKWLIIFLLIIILLLILFYNIVNHNEDKILFFPSKKCVWTPKCDYREVFINVNDCKDIVYNEKHKKKDCEYICGWHFNNCKYNKTVVHYHGNSGSIANRGYIVDICRKFKLNLFLFDYRGYGKSCSYPHKTFLREDGELAYKYIRDVANVPSKNIILWSESLGGISASYTASRNKCGGLILLCSFSSLDDILKYKFKGGSRAAATFLTSILACKMDMIPVKEYLTKVNCPVVVIHSDKDELISYKCSWINYHSITHKNKLHIKIKGGHASPDIKSYQLKEIFEFCNLDFDNISSDVNVSEILENLKRVAAKYHNFID